MFLFSMNGLSIFSLCRGMAPNSNGDKMILSMGGGMVSADFNTMTITGYKEDSSLRSCQDLGESRG